MSTEEDGHTLTRKQLRELRLTGSTPVIGGEEAAAAAVEPAPAQPPAEESAADSESSDPASTGQSTPDSARPASTSSGAGEAPLTRRAARAQERIRTGSVPVVPAEEQPAVVEPPAVEAPVVQPPVVEAPVVQAPVVQEPVVEPSIVEEPVDESPGLVSGIPAFAPKPTPAPRFDAPIERAEPVESEEPLAATPEPVEAAPTPADDDSERPMVGAAFGIGVKKATSGNSAPAAFDELLETGSAGPHKTASTLIFTPSPGAGSLSGPVASTGELLITGTYALPDGMGSQGHALGTTDGKDVDAVLIDGELAPASSPTPIAASSAISTSKPAGEVIRPPVPDKGNKLTLTLAIVAGGLALALAAALIIAFTTGVLG